MEAPLRVSLVKETLYVTGALFLIGGLLSSCVASQARTEGEIPLVPVQLVLELGGVIHWRAPLAIRDTQLQLAEYGAAGEREMRLYDEVVFPTDVTIVFSEGTQVVFVFLRRSPHGGCLLLWDPDKSWLHDPCFGSKFDLSGEFISGPSRRSLDRLPATVRNGIVWVGTEVIYGELNP